LRITTTQQLVDLLDGLFADRADWTSRAGADHWAEVLSREEHPLNSDLPDANLLLWAQRGFLGDLGAKTETLTALDIGCGLGRNSRWLANAGFSVIGVDIAAYAVEEANRRSSAHRVVYLELDFLREDVPGGPFDLVYDSGCFHHLPPHRRISYFQALDTCLAPGGLFGISTFATGKMGSEADDLTLFREGRLDGGIAYSLDELCEMFSAFAVLDVRPMPVASEVEEPAFYQDFLNTALFRMASGEGTSQTD
jgi:SAM-dependent methyltransferase